MITPRPLAGPRLRHTHPVVQGRSTLVRVTPEKANLPKPIEFNALEEAGPSGPGGPSRIHPNARMRAYTRIYNFSDFSFLKNTPDHLDPALSAGRLRPDQGPDRPGFTRTTFKILKGGPTMTTALSKLEEKYGAPTPAAPELPTTDEARPAWKDSEPVAQLADFMGTHANSGLTVTQTLDGYPVLRLGRTRIPEETLAKAVALMIRARRDLEILILEGELSFPIWFQLTKADFVPQDQGRAA